jgi:CRP-like cAMP-binding protein
MFVDLLTGLNALDHTPVHEHPARSTIVHANTPLTESRLLLEGHVCLAKDLPSGHRQIVGLHIAGDFVDLHGFLLKKLDHDIVALTPVRLVSVSHVALERAMTTNSQLTRRLWLSTLRDTAVHREWILSVGRRTAVGRIAHIICEMYWRNRAAGLVEGMRFSFPLTQVDLGEACGLTSVHTNRMLKRLRREGAIETGTKKVRILDWDRLTGIAEFDPGHLYLDELNLDMATASRPSEMFFAHPVDRKRQADLKRWTTSSPQNPPRYTSS